MSEVFTIGICTSLHLVAFDIFGKARVTHLTCRKPLAFNFVFKRYLINFYAEQVTVNPEKTLNSVRAGAPH